MQKKILVAHASKYGATMEIARRIADRLSASGYDVTFEEARTVRGTEPYDAVVLGSALYMFRWRKDAKRFLSRYRKELSQKPCWLFSSGPTGPGDPVDLLKGKIMNERMKILVDQINPREVTVFGGIIQTEKLNRFDRFVMKMVKADTGDFRDWDAIDAWAAKIGKELQ